MPIRYRKALFPVEVKGLLQLIIGRYQLAANLLIGVRQLASKKFAKFSCVNC